MPQEQNTFFCELIFGLQKWLECSPYYNCFILNVKNRYDTTMIYIYSYLYWYINVGYVTSLLRHDLFGTRCPSPQAPISPAQRWYLQEVEAFLMLGLRLEGWCMLSWFIRDIYIYIYMGMDQYLLIPFLVGWTSINPSYFDVNYRGTIGFDTLPYIYSIRIVLSTKYGIV